MSQPTQTSVDLASCLKKCGVDAKDCLAPGSLHSRPAPPSGASAYATGGKLDSYGGPTYGRAVDGVFSQHDGFDMDRASVMGLDIATGNMGQLGGQQFAHLNVIENARGGFASTADALRFASLGAFGNRNVAVDVRTGHDVGSHANQEALARQGNLLPGVPTPPKILPGVPTPPKILPGVPTPPKILPGVPTPGGSHPAVQTKISKMVDVSNNIRDHINVICKNDQKCEMNALHTLLGELKEVEVLLENMNAPAEAADMAKAQDAVIASVTDATQKGHSAADAIADVAHQVSQAGKHMIGDQ